jgi:hypothetical protein
MNKKTIHKPQLIAAKYSVVKPGIWYVFVISRT